MNQTPDAMFSVNRKNRPADELTLSNSTTLDETRKLVSGRDSVTIDCGVMEMDGLKLNDMMKTARAEGVTQFELINVCGQNIIGTGVPGRARISVYGLMGNHSAAFIDNIELNTYPTFFPNDVWCPGDAQVAIGNTSNPTQLNIGGSVDDLFTSYCPSGMFRVAGQGGNRCGLRAGAGIPHVWRKIDYSAFAGMTAAQINEDLLYKYQSRKAKLNKLGFQKFLLEFKRKAEDRQPPVIVFGRKVRDYFMEYAQGTYGVILNVYDVKSPAGYYICSGMTAGKAFIRGEINPEQLGVNVKFAVLTEIDRSFISNQINDFYNTFSGRITESYQHRLDTLLESYAKQPEKIIDGFVKIIPADLDD